MGENNTRKDVQDIMKKSKTNFFYSTVFLNKPKREGLRIIYAYCRMTDDIADNEKLSIEEKVVELKKWKDRLTLSLLDKSEDEFFSILREQIDNFKIPQKPFFDLIEGMEMDVEKNRYETFDDLYKYCYCVASSVGLMSIEIFGYRNDKIRLYAEYLGIALQLTNIIRDVKKDALNGRIYLPLEDMRQFGYSESDLLSSVYNENYLKLMEFESQRAKEYYEKAESFITKEDKGNMVAAEIMGKIYYKLLGKIMSNKFNIYEKDIRVSKYRKILIAFLIFIKYKLFYSKN